MPLSFGPKLVEENPNVGLNEEYKKKIL